MILRIATLTAACLLSGPSNAAPITALVFSPDGTALVSNGERALDVRSVPEAAVQKQIPCDLPKITSVRFAPGGKLLAVAGGEPGVRGRILVLSWPDGRELHRIDGAAELFTCVDFNHDGTRLGASSADHSARVWSLDGTAPPSLSFTLAGHAAPVLAIAFNPSQKSVVTAGADRALKVWSIKDGSLLRSLGHHTEAVHAIAFRPGAPIAVVSCATAADDRTVRIWQPDIGRMVRIVRGHEGPVLALVWSADGSALFTAGREGVIRRLDADSDAILFRQPASADWIYCLALSPDGTALAAGDWSGAVRVHPMRTLQPEERPGEGQR